MRVIIACAGREDDPKWGNHCGVPKHLAPVHGVPLLARTIYQVREYVDDIIVTAPAGDARYALPGATLVHPDPEAANEYAGSRPWWSDTGRTVLLLGDVYWTYAGLATVLNEASRKPRWFGRRGRSTVTASRWGEIFAASWWPEQHRLLDQHLARVEAAKAITRPPGWKLYRSVHGLDMALHRIAGGWTEINDATDDFDVPSTYTAHPAVGGTNARR